MKIQQIGAFEAKTRLSALLELVQHGQVFHITKRGKNVAVLRGVDSPAAPEVKRRDLGARLRALRSRAKAGPETLQELIASGRR